MKVYHLLGWMLAMSALGLGAADSSEGGECPSLVHRSDLRVRDPFILPSEDGCTYYLYASHSIQGPDGAVPGVAVYRSIDLQRWEGPKQVFEVPGESWGRLKVWAPEVHGFEGKYYLFATLTGEQALPTPPGRPHNQRRATQVFVSGSPEGPFLPFANEPHTPATWMALDGTLWVEDGTPYMVFCREWIQVNDGTMELVELEKDLSAPVGRPVTLFRATDAPWVRDLGSVGAQYQGQNVSGFVTDGPFLYRTHTGVLLMIWSSFGEARYAVGMAQSESGSIVGPWKQLSPPLFGADGGHGMLFRRHEGGLMLAIHQPNREAERARFFEIEDAGDRLILGPELGWGQNENRP